MSTDLNTSDRPKRSSQTFLVKCLMCERFYASTSNMQRHLQQKHDQHNVLAAKDELISKQNDEIQLLKNLVKYQQERMVASGNPTAKVSNDPGPPAVIPNDDGQIPKIVIKVEKGGYCVINNDNNF